jgi:hypothetical protein
MIKQTLQILAALIISLASCQNTHKPSGSKSKFEINKLKRDQLVKKYNLLRFSELKQPVLLTIDEFFDGNNDEASIAPNLVKKRPITEYYEILKALEANSKTIDAFVEIKEVKIYEEGHLAPTEWFYTDIVYFIGDLTKDEIKKATEILKPDEVEYDNENRIRTMNKKYKDKNIVYVWWD